jgi:hypothetical protein
VHETAGELRGEISGISCASTVTAHQHLMTGGKTFFDQLGCALHWLFQCGERSRCRDGGFSSVAKYLGWF